MKTVAIILFLAGASFAQIADGPPATPDVAKEQYIRIEKPVKTPDEAEVIRSPWIKLGRTFGKKPQDVWYRNLVNKHDTVEAWLRFAPRGKAPLMAATKRTKAVAYMIQFISIDCDDKRISVERLVPYDKNDDVVDIPLIGFARSYRDPVVPNSIGEIAWRELCRQFR